MDLNARPIQFKGSRWATRVLSWFGWTVDFQGLPAKQGVIVAYPHTSNWDFIVAILAKWAMGFPVVFWGKESLFRVPLLGAFVRRVGGIPVNRASAQGTVDEAAAACERAKANDTLWWLALAPEGTRGAGEGWRSGFYRLALRAQVPLGLGFIDYAQRRVGCNTFIMLTGQEDDDMACIAQHLSWSQGRIPGNAAPIRMKTSSVRQDNTGPKTP
jgi:1-acyl-sn-glycerol-3-phosphate acyltransferase